VSTRTFWTDVKNIAATGIRYPDRPARNESLYRLSYPGLSGGKGIEYTAKVFMLLLCLWRGTEVALCVRKCLIVKWPTSV
jgi:hypothetical protein